MNSSSPAPPRTYFAATGLPTGYTSVAVDVGGVLYYDEPFDIAWIQGTYERTRRTEPGLTVPSFLEHLKGFYRGEPGTFLSQPPARDSWLDVRQRWTSLVQPIPGAADAIQALAQHLPVCVVANQPPECHTALHEMGIAQRVDLVAIDTVVGLSKPDPKFFRWAFDQLGWTAKDVLVIGDRPDHDAAPAHELGCQPALIQPDDCWQGPTDLDPRIEDTYRAIRKDLRTLRSRPAQHASWHLDSLADITP
ncbi:HAD family hydrolase [Streptomyces sp. NBC_01381]|uniref:HAD family hydrolase n=1 Tax=Streptomyces sp. NBC_01381 TaxID=2903845 RepID=UPI00225C117D|nr:HAD family hydrolase [Streptomyces sp. NBC_01381]MCX4666488.1 HAD family hydrolase [Streptomyces sp. NBC_01381]